MANPKSSKVVSGDVIAEIETDKATMEIEAVDDGVLYEIFVKEGTDNVAVGSTLALIKEDNDTEDQLKSFLKKIMITIYLKRTKRTSRN